MSKLEVKIKEIIKELEQTKVKILEERKATGDKTLYGTAMEVLDLIIIELQSAIINSREENAEND